MNKTYPQDLINGYREKYKALERLDESGENFGHADRSLIAMDALIGGQESDYERLVVGQWKNEKLSPETFSNLSDHFYIFKMKPELRELLEIYIVLCDYSQTSDAESFLTTLPKEKRSPGSPEETVLSLIRYGMIPEVEKLDLSGLDKLCNALRYRKVMTNLRDKSDESRTFEFGEDEKYIAFAGVVCSIAGIAGRLNITGSLTLTEEIAKTLLFLLNNRADPNIASQLCNLAV